MGVDGLAEQFGAVPLVRGDERRVVTDRWAAFDSSGQAQQGPDRQVPHVRRPLTTGFAV
jgi:hypothetical protein